MLISNWSSDVCSSDLLQVLAFATVLALTACASLPPPTAELATARQAVARARNADADQYEADEVSQARRALELAQAAMAQGREDRSEEHTSELQSLMRISYAVFCLKKKILPDTPLPEETTHIA